MVSLRADPGIARGGELESAYRPGMPGYVLRDWEVTDYHCYELEGTGLWFRGPPPKDLRKRGYFTAIGAAQTFGCFCADPYPSLLERELDLPSLNLGYSGAGPGFFRRHEALLRYVNEGAFCIVQVMSGRSTSNSLLDNPEGLAHGRRRSDGRPATAEIVFDEVLERELARIPLLPRRAKTAAIRALRLPVPAARKLVRESRQDWLDSYQALLSAITVPTILFWFSVRDPSYRPRYHRRAALLGSYPQLVDAEMVERLKPSVDSYVECVSDRGSPQPLLNRFTGEPAAIKLEADKKPVPGTDDSVSLYSGVWHENKYYPSPEMHEDAARALVASCRNLLV